MNYLDLVKTIDTASQQLLGRAAAVVNQSLVLRNWLVGAYIVEFEQHGEDRARYGERLLFRLARDLKALGVGGLSVQMLERTRQLYFVYPQLGSNISAPVVRKLESHLMLARKAKSSPVVRISRRGSVGKIPTSPLTELSERISLGQTANFVTGGYEIGKPLVGKSPGITPLSPESVLHFSWTHLLELIRIDDPLKRAFYENECLKGNWSKRQLQRQIGSLLYERTGLSKNKAAVVKRAHGQEPRETIEDLIRDPYVLEFTGLAELPHYTENDLETALLDHLQKFLLELGTGFCFEARQFRVTLGNEHDYVDLVFYHRLLRCHVLLDLKIRPFKHGDAGQIHPVRYSSHEQIPLCLCSPKPQRRRPLHRIHLRLAKTAGRASIRRCSIHKESSAVGTDLLRSLPISGRRNQAGKIPQDSLGQALHQDPDRGLSHGVNYYLNYFKSRMMADGDQPPVGILLCSDKDHTKVEFATAGLANKLFVSRSLTALPSAEQLQRFVEADRARIEALTDGRPSKPSPTPKKPAARPARRK